MTGQRRAWCDVCRIFSHSWAPSLNVHACSAPPAQFFESPLNAPTPSHTPGLLPTMANGTIDSSAAPLMQCAGPNRGTARARPATPSDPSSTRRQAPPHDRPASQPASQPASSSISKDYDSPKWRQSLSGHTTAAHPVSTCERPNGNAPNAVRSASSARLRSPRTVVDDERLASPECGGAARLSVESSTR